MDFELRTVLLIVGIIVIAAILLHGLFSIRQSNQPIDVSQLDLDKEDYDESFIKEPSITERVAQETSNSTSEHQPAADAIERHQSLKNELSVESDSSSENELSTEVQLPLDIDDTNEVDSAPIDFDVALDSAPTDENAPKTTPIFSSPIIDEKEDFLSVKSSADPIQTDENIVDEKQSELEFGSVDIPLDDTPEISTSAQPEQTEQESDIMDVLVLNVVGEDGTELDGATLLPTLLTLGFKFGDMNIFHRHIDAAGQGPVLFSLANMVQPGHFDIYNMEQFSTTGISLFMTLPHKHGNLETFNIMLNASAKIAEEFNGQVLDGNRSTLTKQSTQQYIQRIRELERKLLLVKS